MSDNCYNCLEFDRPKILTSLNNNSIQNFREDPIKTRQALRGGLKD